MDAKFDILALDARMPGWIEHMRARGMSEKSISTYRSNFRQYSTYARYKKTRLEDVDWRFLEEWIRHLQGAKQAPTTINSKLQAVGSFYDFLKRVGDIDRNPRDDVRSLKRPENLPKFLSEDATWKILAAAPNARDRALLETLYGCGVRRAEVIGLNLLDVLWPQAILRVRGKGRKERLVPIPLECMKALEAWRAERELMLRKMGKLREEALFVNLYRGARIGRGGVVDVVERVAKLAGVEEKVHPHIFRHTYATHLYNEGGDIRAIQVLLGHGHLSTTQIYTHVGTKRLEETVRMLPKRPPPEGPKK